MHVPAAASTTAAADALAAASSNGTYLNGEVIGKGKTSAAPLKEGDKIGLFASRVSGFCAHSLADLSVPLVPAC